MGKFMFKNNFFESWLDVRSVEILAKMEEKGNISVEEMLVLSLKAQTNHFDHIDEEFREEFKSLKESTRIRDEEFREEFKSIKESTRIRDEEFREEFKSIKESTRGEFKSINEKFERLETKFDKKFSQQDSKMMWGFGLLFTSQMAMVALFLNYAQILSH